MTSREFCRDMARRQRLINIHKDSKEFYNRSVADIVTTASNIVYKVAHHYDNYRWECDLDKKHPKGAEIVGKLSSGDHPEYTATITDDPKAIIPIEKATKLHLLTVLDWHVNDTHKNELTLKLKATDLSLKIYKYYYDKKSKQAVHDYNKKKHHPLVFKHMAFINKDALKLYNIRPTHMLQKCTIKHFLKMLDDTCPTKVSGACFKYLYYSFMFNKYGKAKGLKLIEQNKGKIVG